MIEFNADSLSYEEKWTVIAYGHIIEANWKSEYAFGDLSPEYDGVRNILAEASCKLRDAREMLRPDVESIARRLGAKTNDEVSFVSKGVSRKWIYATIVVEGNEGKEQP